MVISVVLVHTLTLDALGVVGCQIEVGAVLVGAGCAQVLQVVRQLEVVVLVSGAGFAGDREVGVLVAWKGGGAAFWLVLLVDRFEMLGVLWMVVACSS